MTKILEFFIPGEPKAKQRPQFNSLTKSGFTPKQTMDYEIYARQWIYDKWDKEGILRWEEHEALFMFSTSFHSLSKKAAKEYEKTMGCIYPTKKPDFDNVVKIIADTMNKLVFPDDAQIVGALPFKKYAPPGTIPGVRVKIQSVYSIPAELLGYVI